MIWPARCTTIAVGRRSISVPEVRLGAAQRLLRLRLFRDVEPVADDLDRCAGLVAHDARGVAHVAVAAVRVAEPVVDRVLASREQLAQLLLDPREIVGVDVRAPEAGILDEILGPMAEQLGDVRSNEGRADAAVGTRAVRDRRGRRQQIFEPVLRLLHAVLGLDTLGDVAIIRDVGAHRRLAQAGLSSSTRSSARSRRGA